MGWTPEQFKEVEERLERNRRRGQKIVPDAEILRLYAETGSVWETGKRCGLCGQSIWERLTILKAINPRKEFSSSQECAILDFYAKDFKKGDLSRFCLEQGLLKTSVSRWARENGLTQRRRGCSPETVGGMSSRAKEWLLSHEHPKGFLGKNHTPEALRKISEASARSAEKRTSEEEAHRLLKIAKTKAANGNLILPRKASWKQGWYEIDGQRFFFRSRWEVNYACYLHVLRRAGHILKWEYEPETFWFDRIKRGTNNYTPDFRLTFPDGKIEYHEIKGWMDDRSRTKLNRMRIYHPDVKLVLIDKFWFKSHKGLRETVPGWNTLPKLEKLESNVKSV